LFYNYKYVDYNGRNCLGNIPLVWYTLENGVLRYEETNPNANVIMTRDSISPEINVSSPVAGKVYASQSVPLDVVVDDENFKWGYYSYDGGKTKIAMHQTESGLLKFTDGKSVLPNGDYTLTFYAKDYFYLDAVKTVSFKVYDPYDRSKVLAYPNPTTGKTKVVYPEGRGAVSRLYDITGKTLMEIVDDDLNGETPLDFTHSPSGITFYEVILSDKYLPDESYTGTVVKQ
jgi:hypothetical protein